MRLRVLSVTIVAVAAIRASSTSGFAASPAFVSSHWGTRHRHAILPSPVPPSSKSTSLPVATSSDTINGLSGSNLPVNMPQLGEDGVYELDGPEEHAALMEFAKDKLVVLKVYAPWCRACKALAPKFQQFVQDPKYNENIPIIWANLSIQHSKAFVKSLGILALPTVQFYVGGKLLETFPCGPSKVPTLKRKLIGLINDHVDSETRELKPSSIEEAANLAELAAVRVKEEAEARLLEKRKAEEQTESEPSSSLFTNEERRTMLRIPYLKELSLADFDFLLEKARLLTFEPGHLILRQGRPGRLFYVIKSGEVEISQQTGAEDPLISGGYLGTVINRFGSGEYFGERSLITGEPRAASIRATEATTCWAFDTDDFPQSSILSGRSKGLADASEALVTINDRYGVDVMPQIITQQLRESSYANQIRGSVNTPQTIKGVDTDDLSVVSDTEVDSFDLDDEEIVGLPTVRDDDAIFSLLSRFQMLQNVKTCFQYIVDSQARWGDPNIRKRRNLLVKRLSSAQTSEFTTTFKIIDSNGDGLIELLELKRVLETIGNSQSDDEFLKKMMSQGTQEAPYITFEDYMGLMAEAEFYNLFLSIFSSLDEGNTGYVKANELDRVLCGVRDLISDDRKTVIDVEDKEMSIDYEQFARMLLGTRLL